MPKLSPETSFMCENYMQPDGTTGPEVTDRPCGGYLTCDSVLKYDKDLKGKIQHRECTRCKSKQDVLAKKLGTQTKGFIDIANEAKQPRLFDENDYCEFSNNEQLIINE